MFPSCWGGTSRGLDLSETAAEFLEKREFLLQAAWHYPNEIRFWRNGTSVQQQSCMFVEFSHSVYVCSSQHVNIFSIRSNLVVVTGVRDTRKPKKT